MDAPAKDSITLIDANCCIHYSIRLESYDVMGRWTKTLEYYVNKSDEKDGCIGYTDYLRAESERNLVKQLNESSRGNSTPALQLDIHEMQGPMRRKDAKAL